MYGMDQGGFENDSILVILINISLIFTLIACDVENKYNDENKNVSSSNYELIENCMDTSLIQKNIQMIIDLEEVSKYLYVEEVKNKGYLTILENNIVSDELSLIKYNKKVKILSEENLNNQGIDAYLEIDSLKLINDTLVLNIDYDIINVNWIVKCTIDSSCIWNVKEVQIEREKE